MVANNSLDWLQQQSVIIQIEVYLELSFLDKVLSLLSTRVDILFGCEHSTIPWTANTHSANPAIQGIELSIL